MGSFQKFELLLKEGFGNSIILFGNDNKNIDGMYIDAHSLEEFFEDFDRQKIKDNEYDIYLINYLQYAYPNVADVPEGDLFIGSINSNTDDIDFSLEFKELDLYDLGIEL